MVIRFEMDKVNPVGKTAKGVKSIALGEKDFVSSAIILPKVNKNFKLNGKTTSIATAPCQNRAGKGVKSTGPVVLEV